MIFCLHPIGQLWGKILIAKNIKGNQVNGWGIRLLVEVMYVEYDQSQLFQIYFILINILQFHRVIN